MTPVKLYEELKKMEEIFHNASELYHLNDAYKLLQGLIKDAESDIAIQSNKSSGTLPVGKAAFKILEYAEKHSKYSEVLSKAYRTDSYIDVCDSHRWVRFNLSYAPTLLEHPKGYDRYPNMERLVPKEGYNTEVELPSPQDLEVLIKVQKAQLRAKGVKNPVATYTVETEQHQVMFNAEFLLTMIQCLPNAKATISDEAPENKCMLFKADTGVGMLFPIRRNTL